MKKSLIALVLTSVALFAVEPKADADAIWKYVHQENPYWNWKTINDKSKMYESRKPHGPFLTTYVNDIAYEAIKKNEKELPEGSLIVKENYNAEKKLSMLGIKYKNSEVKSEGNWYWIKVTPDGDVKASGTVKGCIKCHANAAASDYIHTDHDYKYELPKN